MNNPFEVIDARLKNIESLIHDLKRSEKSPVAHTDQLLTVKQAAELLCLAVPTIYGLVQRKEIPVSKRSKRLYFSRQELTDWIKEGRKRTNSEILIETESYLKDKKKRFIPRD